MHQNRCLDGLHGASRCWLRLANSSDRSGASAGPIHGGCRTNDGGRETSNRSSGRAQITGCRARVCQRKDEAEFRRHCGNAQHTGGEPALCNGLTGAAAEQRALHAPASHPYATRQSTGVAVPAGVSDRCGTSLTTSCRRADVSAVGWSIGRRNSCGRSGRSGCCGAARSLWSPRARTSSECRSRTPTAMYRAPTSTPEANVTLP
jgi:hypothetical protein